MIKLDVQRILDEQKKSRYWLVQALNSNYETINRLCDFGSVSIHLKTIEKLCNALECEPNDLFVFYDDKNQE